MSRARRLVRGLVCAALTGCVVAGCGGGGDRVPALASLPLPPGARVALQSRTCDRGANAFCALDLIVSGTRYRTSTDLLAAERRALKRARWSHANAPVGQEVGADSPGDRLRLTYAIASQELQAIEFGWIKRPRKITVALSHDLFANVSVLSIQLQLGST